MYVRVLLCFYPYCGAPQVRVWNEGETAFTLENRTFALLPLASLGLRDQHAANGFVEHLLQALLGARRTLQVLVRLNKIRFARKVFKT